MVYTGSDDAKTVTSTLIPAGADTSSMTATPVDESSVKPQPRTALGSARRHHKKKAASNQ